MVQTPVIPGGSNTAALQAGSNPVCAFLRQKVRHCSPESKTQDEHESLVDGAQLGGVYPASRWAETLRVDDRRLLHEDARLRSVERDRRPEAGWQGARRRR